MNKERINVCLDGILLGGSFSGVEHAVRGLAGALAKEGRHNYRFFVPSAYPYSDFVGQNFQTQRVQLPAFRLARIFWEQFRLPAILKREDCDLLHAPAYLAPLFSSKPVVLTVYDLQALSQPQLCLPLNRINYGRMLPPSIRKASGIIVPSRFVAEELHKMFPCQAEKIKIIPIGLDPIFKEMDKEKCKALLPEYGIEAPFIMYAGNMLPKKNLPLLVSSFAIAKRKHRLPHKLVIVGKKSCRYKEIHRRVKSEGMEKEVLFTGYVSEVNLAMFYNAADIFVFPSLYEGFGLPPLEAMACGTPVVSSASGALAETAGPAALMVDPTNLEEIAGSIARLIKDETLRKELIEKGLAHSRRFTLSNARELTESFYEKVAGSK